MQAATVVLLIVSPINIALNVLLIHTARIGILGSALALSCTYWLAFILLTIFTALSPTHARNNTWGGIRLRLVFEWRSCVTFLKLAIPGILMVGTEWSVRLD